MTTTATITPIHESLDGKVIQESTLDYTRYHAYDPTGEYLGWADTYFGAVAYLNNR